MNLPPLPIPTIVEQRRLYTAGDMREYGERCYEAGLLIEPFEPAKRTKPRSSVVDELMLRMGMK